MFASNQTLGGAVILIGPGVYTLTRQGRGEDVAITGDLDVETNLVILGAGADRTVLDGGGVDRVLQARPGAGLEVHGVTIRNGLAVGSGAGVGAGVGAGSWAPTRRAPSPATRQAAATLRFHVMNEPPAWPRSPGSKQDPNARVARCESPSI